MSPVVKIAALAGGVTLPYVEQGDPTGMPVVLLHGVTDSWHSFEPVLPYLPATLRAFAITQRGHGDADRPAGYRTPDFASDVTDFVKVLGLGPVLVVGHSMGGTNAQRFAIDHPELTRGLVLLASFARYQGNAAITELCELLTPMTDPIAPAFVREFQESTLAQPVPPAFLDLVVQESLKVPARVWRGAFQGFLEDNVAAELGRIKAPTLIFWGTRDALCSRGDQNALLAAIPGSRLVAYEGAGHALHWEEPERFARDLSEFARTLDVPH